MQGVHLVTRTRTAATTVVVATLTLFLVAVLTVPAAASGEAHRARHAPAASFEGRAIDLTRGWGDARTCVVWDQDGETTCFRTEQAADAAVARRDRAAARAAMVDATTTAPSLVATSPRDRWSDLPRVQLTSTCSGWLTLYEHSGYAGRSLWFRDRGYYQDLAAWGFANQTSSFRVGPCGATFRDGGWSSYPGWTGPSASSPSMLAGWNDRVRYLRID